MTDTKLDFTKATRLTIVGDRGRLMELWGLDEIRIETQDDGRTVKVFVKGDQK